MKIEAIIPVLSGLVIIFMLNGCNQDEDTLFRSLSPGSTNINFSNKIRETEEFNIIQYLYMYDGGGVGAGDINNDGLVDLFFTANQGLDRLYLNKGNLKFKDITRQAGVGGPTGTNAWTTGVTLSDVNADGWLDIYVCQVSGYIKLKGKNRLYINNQDNTFTERAEEYGLDIASYAQHATFLDYDRDGDLDMFLLNHAIHSPESYQKAELRVNRDSLAGDRLLQNEGGKFHDVSDEAGIFGGSMGYGLSVSVGDVNNDSWPDIYVCNDFHENDYLYYNNGDGTFKENIIGSMGHVSTSSMGHDMGDYNNDGWLDIVSLDMKPADETIFKQSSGVDLYTTYQYKRSFGYHHQYTRNMLQLNAGHLFGENEVQFSEIGQLAGIDATDWSWSAFFADLDNNGAKDLFISNGIPARPNNLDFSNTTTDEYREADTTSNLKMISLIPEGKLANKAFSNKGLAFEEVSESWGLDFMGFSNGSIPVDLDNDGDLDIVTNNLNQKASIFENQSREKEGNNFLKVKLIGSTNNPFGIGARISCETAAGTQVLELYPTKRWMSSVIDGFHVGLGTTDRIQKLTVQWADGSFQEITDVASNTSLILQQADAKAADEAPGPDESGTWMKNVTDRSGVDFIHRENLFIDFSIEALLPRLLSTEGPKIAVGDVNGDGLDDFFIGGAKGQAGSLYMKQTGTERHFLSGDTAVFEDHRYCEDVGAAF
ncbi:MAG: CRTAC1 family protein, partial [Bacteroidales bacterium]|nr:CRTAC1 family protein [Bacteroidales bacterium]